MLLCQCILMCALSFPSTHLFSILCSLTYETQRELENVASKLRNYCLMVTIRMRTSFTLFLLYFFQLASFPHSMLKIVHHHCIHSLSSLSCSPNTDTSFLFPTYFTCYYTVAFQELLLLMIWRNWCGELRWRAVLKVRKQVKKNVQEMCGL